MSTLSAPPLTGRKQIAAVAEVLLLTFLIFLIANLLSLTSMRSWQQEHLYYVVHGDLILILLLGGWLWLTDRSPARYGLTLGHLRADVEAALTVFLPVALAGASLAFLPYTRWYGALPEVAIQLALLFIVARMLSGKPNPRSGLVTIGLMLLLFGGYSAWQGLLPELGRAVASFFYYLFFVGLSEEVLYRGYILTRLNEGFGRPWTFYGIRWGWGALLSSLIFAFTHTLNGVDFQSGTYHLLWWWGVWTFFSGLVFVYICEKTGSIIAPAIVHGLPQALIFLLVGSF